jgi:hypothetical protein
MDNATAFTSPLATVKYGAVQVPWQLDYVVDAVANAKGWQIVLAILALLVAYDQCMSLSVLRREFPRETSSVSGKRENANRVCVQIPTYGTRALS